MLAGGEGPIDFPEADNFPDVDPKLPKDFQQHEGSEPIEGDVVFWVLGFGAEPSQITLEKLMDL